MEIVWGLSAFSGPADAALTRRKIRRLLDCLTAIDEDYLRDHPEAPPIYRSGVVYREELPGEEELWLDVPSILEQGHADCEDLACWRAAELRARFGIPAVADVEPRAILPSGGVGWHAIVWLPNGQVEDPSRVMGMR